ncbi:syntaxin [Vairimorpha necatrix]|uniref:Syntaxin n=1 Tax=Vairimorpha necatrix TaxID=6039 RepID=A0AAX4J8E1_9MICR
MERLTTTSKRINDNLKSLEEYSEAYKALTQRFSGSTFLDQQKEKTLLDKIQEIGNKFKNLSKSTKEKIFSLADLAKDAPIKEKEIIEWHISGHSKKLIKITNLFREYTFTYKKNVEERTKNLYKTANINASDKQIDKYLSSPNSGIKINSFFSLKSKINEANRRQQELKNIQELTEEVTAITKMVSDLTYQQSVNVDMFGDDMIDIENHMVKSNTELTKTLKYKIRRKKFWRNVILFLFLCLMIWTVYYAIKDNWFGWKNNFKQEE